MSRHTMLWIDRCFSAPEDRAPESFTAHFELHTASSTEIIDTGGPVTALRPDVICFDYDYPDMAALRQIPETKRHHPSIPILMLTLQRSADLAVWALRARVFDYLIKPLDAADVEQCLVRLKSVLEARRSQGRRQAISSNPRAPREARYYAREAARTRVQRAIPHIAKHFATRIGEPAVAELCGMSPFRFSREFRAAFGVSFQEYLCNLRLTEARRLLENYAMPIADVGAAVGFEDPSYFARVFKRVVGLSPSDYRASLGREESEAAVAAVRRETRSARQE
jgi:YesN/AraC family two-component response regulator